MELQQGLILITSLYTGLIHYLTTFTVVKTSMQLGRWNVSFSSQNQSTTNLLAEEMGVKS